MKVWKKLNKGKEEQFYKKGLTIKPGLETLRRKKQIGIPSLFRETVKDCLQLPNFRRVEVKESIAGGLYYCKVQN